MNHPNEGLNAVVCDWFEARLSDFVEGTLSAEEAGTMRRHAAGCAACGELLNDLHAAMEVLAQVPELPQPRGLHEAILARTSAARAELSWRATFAALWHGMRQPRFGLGFAMSVFVGALILNTTGVNLAAVRWHEWTPAHVSASLQRGVNRAWARSAAYYNDLRVIYTLQSRLREPETAPSVAPRSEPRHKSGAAAPGRDHSGLSGFSGTQLAERRAPVAPRAHPGALTAWAPSASEGRHTPGEVL